MTPVIKFEYVFQVCGLTGADSKKKCQVIHEVIEIFEYLVSGGDIISFNIKKDGDKYQSIEFFFSQVVTSSIPKTAPSGEKLAE